MKSLFKSPLIFGVFAIILMLVSLILNLVNLVLKMKGILKNEVV